MIPTPVTIRGRGDGTEAELGEPGIANSLTGVHGGQRSMVMLPDVAVRRLTPVERERLMAWPDGWTEWGLDENGERVEMTDTARNRMTGNGVVSTIAEWLARRVPSDSATSDADPSDQPDRIGPQGSPPILPMSD